MGDALWIREAEVAAAVDLRMAAASIRRALEAQHAGSATTLQKTAAAWGNGHTLHALGGIDGIAGLVGTKTWAHTEGGATPLLVLWDAATGALRAVVEAFALGQLRTAAISTVATDLLAPPDASTMAMIGTGKQALAQVAAVIACRPIEEVRIFSPTPAHREALRERLAPQLPSVAVVTCPTAAAAVADAAVVTTATRARQPVLSVEQLSSEVHLNAVGAITPERRELDDATVAAASLVVSDAPAAARQHSVELADVGDVVPLHDVVGAGTSHHGGLTIFKAMGLGLADIAVGSTVLREVVETGGGRRIPTPIRSAPVLFTGAPTGGRT